MVRQFFPITKQQQKITSQNTIPLAKFYGEEKIYAKLEDDGSVELRRGKIGEHKIYLPTPDVQRIKAVVINENRYYSEMFIQNL